MGVWAAARASHPGGYTALPSQFANHKEGNQMEMNIFLDSFDVKISLELHTGAA